MPRRGRAHINGAIFISRRTFLADACLQPVGPQIADPALSELSGAFPLDLPAPRRRFQGLDT
jgi:hypothetical protein